MDQRKRDRRIRKKYYSIQFKLLKKLNLPMKYKNQFFKRELTITEKEFCNDEDGGYDIYTYQEYEQSYIQIRFVLFKMCLKN